MTLEAGTRLGHYEVLSSLGAGGMGEVYRAKDTRLDRGVAVKVFPAELGEDRDFKRLGAPMLPIVSCLMLKWMKRDRLPRL